MSDVLAGMTRKEAEAFVAQVSFPCDSDDLNKLMALAALGAKCVGAEEYHDAIAVVGGNYTAKISRPNRVLVLEGE